MDGRTSLVHRILAPRSPPRSAFGRVGPPREGEGKRQPAIWDLFRRALDLGVPFREQAAALFGGAVFGEIEVDELDLAELRRMGRDRRRLVRRDLVLLVCRADRLRGRAQR